MCHGHAHQAHWGGREHRGPHPVMIVVGLFIVFTIFKSGLWIPLLAIGLLCGAAHHHRMEWGGWHEKHKHGGWHHEKRKHDYWHHEKRKNDDEYI